MISFDMATGVVAEILSYLDPPLGVGIQPTTNVSNHSITRNE